MDGTSQTTVPKNEPTAAVAAMAIAPQSVTLAAPVATLAPPTRAATAPNAAREISELAATTGTMTGCGLNHANISGSEAPTANVAAEAAAA